MPQDTIPTYAIDLPGYRVDQEPDYQTIGAMVDAEIKKHFLGQTIAVRGLGSQEHPGKTADELIEIIKELGTDRYDPSRRGDRHENTENKHIDLHVLRRKVTEKSKIFWQLAWSFYEYPLKMGRKPVRIDIVIVYDPAQLRTVRTTHTHTGKPVIKQDGFVFRDPENRPAAIKAIFKIA